MGIMLTNSAVSLRVLGTLNGVATSTTAMGRAIGPAIEGWMFSVGLNSGYVILPWWTLAALAAIGAIPVWYLVEMEMEDPAADDYADPEHGDSVTGEPFSDNDEAAGQTPAMATPLRQDPELNSLSASENGLAVPGTVNSVDSKVTHSSRPIDNQWRDTG